MRDDTTRLIDILDSISIIEKYNSVDLSQLNELEFQGVIRCLEVIGEACRYLSQEIKSKHSEIPWRAISDMRNILIHQYFEVDEESVENVIKNHLPKLKETINKIIKSPTQS